MRKLGIALFAIGALYLVIGALQSDKDTPAPTRGDNFVIRAVVDGKTFEATASCEGDIAGTGYLADKQASFDACTFDKSVTVHQYLQHRAACADVIRDVAALAERPFGRATITGVYFDEPLKVELDAVNGNECDKAAWKLLGPLLPS